MQFLTSWRDCLLVLKPDNAKLFGLVTLNATRFTLGSICRYGLLLVLSLVACIIYTDTHWFMLPVVALLISLFTVYLAARPSTLRKDCSYFLGYGKYLIWFSLFFIAWLFMMCAVSLSGIPCWFRQLPLYAPFFPFFSITVAFLCDTDGSFVAALRSIGRGFLFVFYNLPICVVICAFFLGLAQLVYTLLPDTLAALVLIALWPLAICTYINLYVKRVHDQFSVYFGKA